jgi:branched-chain amino acid transport system substrate-binding protein
LTASWEAKEAKYNYWGQQVKKWLSVAAVMLLCLALVIGVACGGGEDEEGVKEVQFGMGLPLSGLFGAVLGVPAKQGLELANEKVGEFTVAGQSYRWKLIFEDSRWTGEGGAASTTKLIHEHGVKIMHQLGADPGFTAQPICEEAGVLLLTSAGIDALGPDKPYTFQVMPNSWWNAPSFFRWLSTAHPEVETVAMVNTDDINGRGIADANIAAAEHYGLEVIASEFTPREMVEFYPLATRVVNLNPDLIHADSRVLEVMRELGYENLAYYVLWGTSYGESRGWDIVQDYLIYYPVAVGEGLPEGVRGFAAEYEARYGLELAQTAYWEAMMLYVMTEAVKKAGTVDDVDKIIATLETETFDTPAGVFECGGEKIDGIGHFLSWPAWIGEIKGQDYHVIEEILADEAEALAEEVFGK